jgi:hypothetical protein
MVSRSYGRPPRQRLPWAPLLFSLTLLTAGAGVLWAETRAYVEATQPDAELVAHLMDRPLFAGPSLSSARITLGGCMRALRSLRIRLVSPTSQEAVWTHCRKTAEGILVANPFDGYASLVSAVAAGFLGDSEGLNARLARSQFVARSEQWLAELRVDLGEDRLGLLDDSTLAGHDSDLRLLARSERGVRSIARRYIEDASFKQRIFRVVAALPDEVQRRFVDMVAGAAAEVSR